MMGAVCICGKGGENQKRAEFANGRDRRCRMERVGDRVAVKEGDLIPGDR